MTTFAGIAGSAHAAWSEDFDENPGALIIVVGASALVPVAAASLTALLDTSATWAPAAALNAGALRGVILHGVLEGSDPPTPVTFARPADGGDPTVYVGAQADPEPGDPDTAASVADHLLREIGAAWS